MTNTIKKFVKNWTTYEVPSKTSDLTNDSGFLTSDTWVTSINGLHWDLVVNVPTKTSDLINDAGFVTNQVDDTAYTSSWDWVTTIAPSKNAVYDKIASIDSNINIKADDAFVMHLSWAETILDWLKVFESNDDPTPNASSATTSITLKWKNLKKWWTSWYKYTSIDFKDKDDALIAKFSWLTTPDWWSGFMAWAWSDPTSTSWNLWLIADNANNNKLLLIPPTTWHNYWAVRYDYYNSNTVRLSGNQTISWTKTFNTSPVVPSKNTNASSENTTVIATEAQVAKKQDTISDLETIRSWATSWATAVQPWDLGTAASKDTWTSSWNIPVLDSNGKLNSSVLPAVTITDTFTVTNKSDLIWLTSAEKWDVWIVTSENKTYILSDNPYSTQSNWKELLTPTDAVTSVNSKTWAVVLTTDDISDSSSSNKFVTSTEKSTWNWKQDALNTQTAYTSKWSATKVPQISTNNLWQVTWITEVTITQPTKTSDLTNDSWFLTSSTWVTSVNWSSWSVTLTADNISDSSTTKKFTTAAQQTAWSAKMPWFSLNISHATAGNPRETKFITINYWNMTQYGAAYFKLSATSCHPDWSGYNYLVDIIIWCTYKWVVTAKVLKYVHSSVDQYSPGYAWWGKYFGDVFYVKDTENQKVYFYILWWQYTSSDFTPATKIGNTSLTNVTQHTWSASYYDWDWTDRVFIDWDSTLYALMTDIPTKTSQLTNDSWFITSSSLSWYQTTANLKTSLSDNSDSYYPSQKAVKTAVDAKANTSDVLTKTNTTSFAPSADYHPATKKYVDDNKWTNVVYCTQSEYDALPSTKTSDGKVYMIYATS